MRLGRISLALAIATLALIGLVTFGALLAVLSAGHHGFERMLNRGYVVLSVCGEGLALAGVATGVAGILRGKRERGALFGVVVGVVGALLFAPAVTALMFNGFIWLLSR